MSTTPNNPWSANPNGGNYAPPPTQDKGGMPVWGWVLLGCFGSSFFVIAILAAILFPVFAQAREKARQTSCLSNEKQMGLAAMMYAQDYDDKLPPADKWMDVLGPYAQNEKIYHCPSARTKDVSDYGYAYSDAMSRKTMSSIASPRDTTLLYDSSALTRNAHDAAKSFPAPGRHSRGNNIGYADGHAKYKKDATTP